MIAPVKTISNAATQIVQSAPVKKVADEIQELCSRSPISLTGETDATYLQKLLKFKNTCQANSLTIHTYKDKSGLSVTAFECIAKADESPVSRVIKTAKGKCVEDHFIDCTNHAVIYYNEAGKVAALRGSENGQNIFHWYALK